MKCRVPAYIGTSNAGCSWRYRLRAPTAVPWDTPVVRAVLDFRPPSSPEEFAPHRVGPQTHRPCTSRTAYVGAVALIKQPADCYHFATPSNQPAVAGRLAQPSTSIPLVLEPLTSSSPRAFYLSSNVRCIRVQLPTRRWRPLPPS